VPSAAMAQFNYLNCKNQTHDGKTLMAPLGGSSKNQKKKSGETDRSQRGWALAKGFFQKLLAMWENKKINCLRKH